MLENSGLVPTFPAVPVRKALTMQDVMKMPEAERRRRGTLIGKKAKRKTSYRAPQPSHPTLKRWAKAEKPIQIIG
jgi:hypothetical protein